MRWAGARPPFPRQYEEFLFSTDSRNKTARAILRASWTWCNIMSTKTWADLTQEERDTLAAGQWILIKDTGATGATGATGPQYYAKNPGCNAVIVVKAGKKKHSNDWSTWCPGRQGMIPAWAKQQCYWLSPSKSAKRRINNQGGGGAKRHNKVRRLALRHAMEEHMMTRNF